MSSGLSRIIRSLKGLSDHGSHDRHHDDHGTYHDRFSGYGDYRKGHDGHFSSGAASAAVRKISEFILKNRRLALLVILAILAVVVLFFVCAVWLVVALVKLCGPVISGVESNGLKGVVDTVAKIITRIWEGSGK